MVAFVPLVACLDVTVYETHLHDVGVLDTHISLLCAMMLCMPCLLYATCLAFLASLHESLLAYVKGMHGLGWVEFRGFFYLTYHSGSKKNST